jgi:hypothetical protein
VHRRRAVVGLARHHPHARVGEVAAQVVRTVRRLPGRCAVGGRGLFLPSDLILCGRRCCCTSAHQLREVSADSRPSVDGRVCVSLSGEVISSGCAAIGFGHHCLLEWQQRSMHCSRTYGRWPVAVRDRRLRESHAVLLVRQHDRSAAEGIRRRRLRPPIRCRCGLRSVALIVAFSQACLARARGDADSSHRAARLDVPIGGRGPWPQPRATIMSPSASVERNVLGPIGISLWRGCRSLCGSLSRRGRCSH